MENVIYNELRARGFSVDVGIVPRRYIDESGKKATSILEVDFIANQGSKRYYIQSAFALPDDAKREQESASLKRINDSFKKIIVVKDTVNATFDDDGIVTMGLFDFLLDPNSLDK